jgi:hypothetical protein
MSSQSPPGGSTITAGMNQILQWRDQPQPFVQQPMRGFAATLTPIYLSLLAQARELASEKHQQYQFAVVLVQAACELATEQNLIALMQLRGTDFLTESILESTDVTSLATKRLRKLFIALSGDNPAEAKWWARWLEARELRHRVAHAGAIMTSEQAARCIDSAAEYIQHLIDVTERVRAGRAAAK